MSKPKTRTQIGNLQIPMIKRRFYPFTCSRCWGVFRDWVLYKKHILSCEEGKNHE